MSIQLDFSGEIALVTGGATGLGFAIARGFGLHGAVIGLNDLTEDRVEAACERLRRESITCRGHVADVRDAGAVSTLVTRLEEELGTPGVIVANAGLYPNTPFLELSEAEWDRVIDTNLKGVFLTCQAAARSMVRAGKAGRIIVVGSTAAQRAVWGWSHYCTSKAAAVMLTRAMALELGTHGIRVNAVLPGYIDVADGGRHLSLAYREGARRGLTRTPGDTGRRGTRCPDAGVTPGRVHQRRRGGHRRWSECRTDWSSGRRPVADTGVDMTERPGVMPWSPH